MVARLSARVVMQATIDTEGRVRDVFVVSCSLPGFGFELAALEALRQWRYRPAMRDGTPVDVMFTVTADFTVR